MPAAVVINALRVNSNDGSRQHSDFNRMPHLIPPRPQ